MTQEELDKIVEQHQHWIHEDVDGWEGMRADLRDKNLSGLSLVGARLDGASLDRARLDRASLDGASLVSARLDRARLDGASLDGASLVGARLDGASLDGARLDGASLVGASLDGASLDRARLDGAEKIRLGQILTEPMTGYKKTQEGVVITAEIPVGAIVFCINGSKCRTNRAKITDMAGHDVLHSQHDNSFEYRLEQEIEIKDFNLMYNIECASGFHFFRTREEADNY